MELEMLFGMAMLGRAVVELLALGFGLGLLGFAVTQLVTRLGEKSPIATARAARIAGGFARAVVPSVS